jgi:hypothetical protein
MSQELIYTSSPKGLKLGARGFCTVATTSGMAKNLADRLESLSGYRQLYPPGSPDAHLNPVNFSYLRFVMGGQTYYLLSRIADAGLDYTQRTNKLAHHIALQQAEFPSAGPAWLASQPEVFETMWNREPEVLSNSRRTIPQGRLNARICSAWKVATGDAGWAGVLAQNILTHASSEAYLIYKPGTDVLELFTEAQALLSPEQRWEATFSTYFTNLPPGVECRWRGVIDGSPEALRARRAPDKLVIDLTATPVQAPESDMVHSARNGAPDRQGTNDSTKRDGSARPVAERSVNKRLPLSWDTDRRDADLSVSKSQPPALPCPSDFKFKTDYAGAGLSRRERAAWLTAIVVLLAALGGIVLYLTRTQIELPEPVVAKRDQKRNERPIEKAEPHDIEKRDPPTTPSSGAEQKRTAGNETVRPVHPSDNKSTLLPKNDETPALTTASKGPVPEKRITWESVLSPDGFHDEVQLPEISKSGLNEKWKKAIVLTDFHSKPDIHLSLLTSRPENHAALRVAPSSPGKWDIMFTRPNENSERRLATVGFLEGSDDKLKFQWAETAVVESNGVDFLNGSILCLRLGGPEPDERRLISLLPTIRRDNPLKWNAERLIESDKWQIKLNGAGKDIISIPDGQASVACIRITNALPTQSTLTPGESKMFSFGNPKAAQVKITFGVSSDRRPSVAAALVDPQDGKSPFHEWYVNRCKERRQLLENAIFSYITKPSLAMHWPKLSNELKVPVDLKAFRSKLAKYKLQDLSQGEQSIREKLEAPRYSGVPIAKSHDLQEDEEEWPYLLSMDAKLLELLKGSEIYLKISRRIQGNDQSTPVQSAEVDVFVAGKF